MHSFFAVPTGVAGGWIARRARAPHVLTVIGADVHDPSRISPDRFPPLGAVVRRVVRRADWVAAISHDVAVRARSLTGRTDIEVVPCGIAPATLPERDRAAFGWNESDFVVVTVARLVRRKRIDALARAAARVPRIKLEIVGDGPEHDRIAAASDTSRVRLAGALPSEAVDARLVSADAFALVSAHEGFGLVYLEAMRAGLPVIAGDTGGQTDFLTEGENALLVQVESEEALTVALTRLSTDAGLRDRLAAGARATAPRFTADTMATAYEAVYERVRRTEERVP